MAPPSPPLSVDHWPGRSQATANIERGGGGAILFVHGYTRPPRGGQKLLCFLGFELFFDGKIKMKESKNAKTTTINDQHLINMFFELYTYLLIVDR